MSVPKIVQMPARTYSAKLFEVKLLAGSIKVAGTLDGYIDFATPRGTYSLTLVDAEALAAALSGAVLDVRANCLYDEDELLERE